MAKTKAPPVFKIRAEVAAWCPSDPTPRPTLVIVEECLATSMPNRCDMKRLLQGRALRGG